MEARNSGLLDPLFKYLKKRVAKCSDPLEPTGAEWPYLRARQDGRAKEAKAIMNWLEGRSKPSPDEAQNTEE